MSHVLATSREALRIESERVFRLFPLTCPRQGVPCDVADILAYPATELFVERIAANLGGYELSEEEAPIVAEICAQPIHPSSPAPFRGASDADVRDRVRRAPAMQSPRVVVRSRTVTQLWRLRSAAAPYRYGETIATIFIGRGAASPSMAGEIFLSDSLRSAC